MYLDPDWRVVTIGDGDLSFSAALSQHYGIRALIASVYDDLPTLAEKYTDQHWRVLHDAGVEVVDRLDICRFSSVSRLPKRWADVVIFQFPLLPALKTAERFQAASAVGDDNLRHRLLLRSVLVQCANYLLSHSGQGRCYITSKDVKPYADWNLENSLAQGLSMNYMGSCRFLPSRFPGYHVRNVERGKKVKDTAAVTYVWGMPCARRYGDEVWIDNPKHRPAHCRLCGAGPLRDRQQQDNHYASKQHQRRLQYERNWQNRLHNLHSATGVRHG